MNPRISDLSKWIDPPRGGLWHGGPSAGSVTRGVSATEAAWKPAPDRHSIWELTLHIAYWKYAVRRRIEGGPRGGFPRKPSDWPVPASPPTEKAWDADRKLVRLENQALVTLIEGFDPGMLDEVWGGANRWTYMDLLSGVALHDAYHVGQIQLMKRLYRCLNP